MTWPILQAIAIAGFIATGWLLVQQNRLSLRREFWLIDLLQAHEQMLETVVGGSDEEELERAQHRLQVAVLAVADELAAQRAVKLWTRPPRAGRPWPDSYPHAEVLTGWLEDGDRR